MRRHPALRELSSEHHSGLVLARKARQAATGDVDEQREVWNGLVARFRTELDGHFRREEDGLLVLMWKAGERLLVERTLAEHDDMRAMVALDDSGNLAHFADLLSDHIRFEEQELFQRAQELLDLDRLDGLGSGTTELA